MIVSVVPYSVNWINDFDNESREIQSQIEGVIVTVHHIGSTAVPGLMAKPIIDIMLEVSSLLKLDAQNAKFSIMNYEVMGEYGMPGRRYFRKGGDKRTHQIHAFETGDFNLLRHLAFRDYLIEHKEVAEKYGKLKLRLAKMCNHDILLYGDGKEEFVKYHEAKALDWYRRH